MSDLYLCLMGPTASGKTELASRLIKKYPFEIISVDSAMVFKGMDIGTAKPTQEELKETPHHLINMITPRDSFSAADFCEHVRRLSVEIHARGNYPLLVGGTMMYFNALQKGLSSLPQSDKKIRDKLSAEGEQFGWPYMHDKLREIDEESAKRIHTNDSQRIARALEVYYITSKPLAELLAAPKPESNEQFINIALFPQNRAWLHERIAERFKKMLSEGFIDEVRALLDKWALDESMISMRCVGYRQALQFIKGQFDEDELLNRGIAATRQLAKRQLTWLRSWPNVTMLDPQDKDIMMKVMVIIDEILDNNRN